MTFTTKKMFIASLISVLGAGTLLTFLVFEIEAKGAQLEEQINILNENTSKESAYVRLRRLAQETEPERSALAAAFFSGEGDSITFLGEIEAMAQSLNLSLETEGLEKVTLADSPREYIRATFSYEGARDTVFAFSKLFEVIPYHSVVESLRLREISPGNWQGTLTVRITIQTP